MVEPPGDNTLPGYVIAPGANGDVYLWRETPDGLVPVLAYRVLSDDPAVWEILAAAIRHGEP